MTYIIIIDTELPKRFTIKVYVQDKFLKMNLNHAKRLLAQLDLTIICGVSAVFIVIKEQCLSAYVWLSVGDVSGNLAQ